MNRQYKIYDSVSLVCFSKVTKNNDMTHKIYHYSSIIIVSVSVCGIQRKFYKIYKNYLFIQDIAHLMKWATSQSLSVNNVWANFILERL